MLGRFTPHQGTLTQSRNLRPACHQPPGVQHLDGAAFEIDLTEANAAKLRKALVRYVDAGRRVRNTGPSTRQPASRRGEGRGRDELAQIRAWAVEAGYEVAERGRIAKNIIEAYDAR